MDTLPYELLQVIASWLLPRGQCRFAMISRWCYKWLYNDLLRWHARKDTIQVPKYTIPVWKFKLKWYHTAKYQISIREYNSKLCVTMLLGPSYKIQNYTSDTITFIWNRRDNILIGMDICKPSTMIVRDYGIKIFDHKYKYMQRKALVFYASIRASPLLSLPADILKKIMKLIPTTDYNTLRNILCDVHEYFACL